MKITNVSINAISNYTKINKVSVNAKTPTGGQADRLEISSDAMLFANAIREVNNIAQRSTQEKAERINAITQQIQEGTYKVDPKAVADKILLSF